MAILLFLLFVVCLVVLGLILRLENRMEDILKCARRNSLDLDRIIGKTSTSSPLNAAPNVPKTTSAENEITPPLGTPKAEAELMQATRPPPLPEMKTVDLLDRTPDPGKEPSQAARQLQQVSVPTPAAEKKEPLVDTEPGVFQRIWNWLLVGEEHRREDVNVEFAVASTWLLRISILAIVTGIAYFIKWSIDQNIIGPSARIGIGVLAGTGMLVAGMRLVGKRYHLIGQGLLGGGLLVMYVNLYAANQWYGLLGTTSTTALMVCVVAACGLLAVRADSLLIALLGLAGGYLTPVLMHTPDPNLHALYLYLLLLGIGVLVVSNYKRWHLLEFLAFLGTYGIFAASLRVYTDAHFALAITFLSAMFVVHSSVVYLHNIRRQIESSVLEVVQLLINGFVFAAFAYHLISSSCGRPYPALLSLGLAAYYIAHVLLFLGRGVHDRKLLTALIAAGAACTAWSLPLMMEKESLTIAFALLSLMFLWLGKRMSSTFLTQLAYGVYMFLFLRLLTVDMPRDFGVVPETVGPMREYWPAMLQRLWTFGFSIASVASAYFLQRLPIKPNAQIAVVRDNDTKLLVSGTVARTAFYWAAVVICFLFVHLEVNTCFHHLDTFRLPMLTIWWCVTGFYFLMVARASGWTNQAAIVALLIVVMAVFLKMLSVDLASWDLSGDLVFDVSYSPLIIFARTLDFGVAIALFVGVWVLLRSRDEDYGLRTASGYGALLLLFIYASLELRSCLHWTAPTFLQGGMSVLWSVFAICFIAGGLWRHVRPIRFVGLLLFAIVVAKVLLLDMKDMAIIVKMMAFVAVGILLLLGSVVYIHSGQRFLSVEDES